MLRCKINSAKLRAPGGPVSSNSGNDAFREVTMSTDLSKERSTSEKLVWSRVQLFAAVETTARKILQHCISVDCSFCFAGLEWNGHAVGEAPAWAATAPNAQWFEIAIQEKIMNRTIVNCTMRLRPIAFMFDRILAM